MSALSYVRPQHYVIETFDLWAFHEKNGNLPAGRPYKVRDCESLEDGVREIGNELWHKRHVAIRRTNHETGRITLHIYVGKRKSQPRYVYHNYETRRVHDYYAEHVQDIVLSAELLGERS